MEGGYEGIEGRRTRGEARGGPVTGMFFVAPFTSGHDYHFYQRAALRAVPADQQPARAQSEEKEVG